MKKLFLIIVVFFSAFSIIHAEPIPSDFSESVVFISSKIQNGQIISGTGFFVTVKDKKQTNKNIMYLVTAKHVIIDKITKKYFDEILVRLNKHDGGFDFIPIKLSGTNSCPVIVHKDKSVDFAAIAWEANEKIYKYKSIPENMIGTKEMFKKYNVGVGDETFLAGVFSQYLGIANTYPIVKFGKIVILPDEKIEFKFDTNESRVREVFLVDLEAVTGNSGSPLFINLNNRRGITKDIINPLNYMLGGLISGYYPDNKPLKDFYGNNSTMSISLKNDGFSLVEPSYLLHDML